MELISPNLFQEKEKTEFINQVNLGYKLIGTIPVKKGLTLWALNMETLNIKPIQIKAEATLMFKDGKAVENIKRTAIHEKDCVYICALNRKSVEKKILKVVNKINKKS